MQLSTVRRLHPCGEPVFVYAERDAARHEVGVDVAGAVAFEDVLPVRTFPVYKGKRHFDGLHFFGATASHVPFESSLEREAMLWFEYAGAVAVASQPFAVEWPPGSRPQRHVPDLFVRYANGTGEVVDVRPPHRADDPAFSTTAAVCTNAGLGYSVFTGVAYTLPEPSPLWAATFTVLSSYRHSRCAPPAVAPFVEAFSSGRALARGAYSVARRLGQDRDVTLAQTYHLIWRRVLAVDPRQRLASTTQVTVV